MAGYGRTLYKLISVSTIGLLLVGLHFMTGFGSHGPSKSIRARSGFYARTLSQFDDIGDQECRVVNDLANASLKCDFINHADTPCVDEGLVPYYPFLYCELADTLWAAMIVLVIWWLFLFVGLAVCADDFFCPSLVVISKTLRLSPNVAGVTFLAFGNGAPDFFSAITALGGENSDSQLAVGGLFGAGMFVTSVVVGAIALVKPFKAMERPFLRDIIFYIVAVYWAFFMLWKEKVYLAEAIGFVCLYVLYVIVVIVSGNIYKRQKEKKTLLQNTGVNLQKMKNIEGATNERMTDASQTNAGFSDDSGIGRNESSISLASTRQMSLAEDIDYSPDRSESVAGDSDSVFTNGSTSGLVLTQQVSTDLKGDVFGPVEPPITEDPEQAEEVTPFWQFLDVINPINVEEWADMKIYSKVYEIFKAPLVFVINLTCPVVNYEIEDTNGWNRHLNSLQCLLAPTIAFMLISGPGTMIGDFPAILIPLGVGAALSLLVFCTSQNDQKPKYHWIFGYIGFLTSIIWIYIIAGEVVVLLGTFGVVLGISDAILGLTLLAWGNSIGDLIADTVMARQGFARMGFAACYGAPFFNLTLGFGLSLTLQMVQSGESEAPLSIDSVQLILSSFLMLNLAVSLVAIPLVLRFKIRRAFGAYLLGLYLTFIVIALLTESGIINFEVK